MKKIETLTLEIINFLAKNHLTLNDNVFSILNSCFLNNNIFKEFTDNFLKNLPSAATNQGLLLIKDLENWRNLINNDLEFSNNFKSAIESLQLITQENINLTHLKDDLAHIWALYLEIRLLIAPTDPTIILNLCILEKEQSNMLDKYCDLLFKNASNSEENLLKAKHLKILLKDLQNEALNNKKVADFLSNQITINSFFNHD